MGLSRHSVDCRGERGPCDHSKNISRVVTQKFYPVPPAPSPTAAMG